MQKRPLTVEEYVIAGVSARHCMNCGDEKPHNSPPGYLRYFRKDGLPQVLCSACFDRSLASGGVAFAAHFASPAAAVTNELLEAHCIPGLPQKTPEQVERTLAEFRNLSPTEIQAMSLEIPHTARAGDCLEIFGPIFWFAIMRCLEWLRESCEVSLGFMLKRWEKWPSILEKNLGEPRYEVWKARLAAMAEQEFSFRYNVLLSDSIEAAHNKAAAKQDAASKIKIFEVCKATVCRNPPPASFPGGQEELRRFIEYIDAAITGLGPATAGPTSNSKTGSARCPGSTRETPA